MVQRRRSSLVIIAIAVLLGAAWALPGAASGASGSTTIDLRGGAVSALRDQGAKIRAVYPARILAGKLRLPVREGIVGSTATINLKGSLSVRRGPRSVRIERLQARLAGSTVRIAGTIKGLRLTVFTATKRVSLNPAAGSASLRNARLKLTRTAGRLIKSKLKLKRTPIGGVGKASVDALVTGTSQSPGAPAPGGPPVSTPITDEPPLLARPATATNVSAATVTWHVRDSWVRYIASGSGSSALGAAIPGTAINPAQHPCSDSLGNAGPLVYSFTMPLTSGWHDAASGQTALYTSGGVRFFFPGHGIDLEVKDLEIELNGASSRVIARFDGRLSTTPGNKRAVLVNLVNGGPAPGQTATVRGNLPTSGSLDVFAGFYPVGAGFGCVTVSYS